MSTLSTRLYHPLMHRLLHPRLALLLLLVFIAGGCTSPQPPAALATALPPNWDEATAEHGRAAFPEPDWWQQYASTELSELITDAVSANADLSIARERVLQAELTLRSVGASLFPQLNLEVGTSSQHRLNDKPSPSSHNSTTAVSIGYETDLWGSHHLRLDAARDRLNASHFDLAAAKLSLIGSVVKAYSQILSQRTRLEIAHANLAIAERLLSIVAARQRHGTVSSLELSRQQTTVLSQRAAIAPMQTQHRQYLRALALLLGRTPQGFDVHAQGLYTLALPNIAHSQPLDLLERRPDVAAAQARLQAAAADIALARTELFPLKLSLTASSGLNSGQFALQGLGNPVTTAGLSLALLQRIFDGGRLQANIRISESQQRQLLESYRLSILTALKEVDDAYGLLNRYQAEEQAHTAIRAETERGLRLAELRYREGSDSLSTLLDEQRILYAVRDQLAKLRLSRLEASVDLYKALGGGWQVTDERLGDGESKP